MKYLQEYRDPGPCRILLEQISAAATRPWTIMEICGGQTHAILRHGLDQLLPPSLTLVHGPGCPVCVTPLETIDRALAIAARPGVIFTSFGDMLRVPGSRGSLLEARSRGADVQAGADAAAVSARFHRTLLDLLVEASRRAARLTGLRTVALGGGSFQNEILASLLPPRLEAAGLRPLLPRELPPNDGAVALGQAVVARAGLA